MHPLIPLVNIDTSSFSLSGQTKKLSSCEEISVKVLNTDMVFHKVNYYESKDGYVSWIGITGSDTYISLTKNTHSGDFIALSHSQFGYFQIRSRSDELSCCINEKGNRWAEERTLNAEKYNVNSIIKTSEEFIIDIVFVYHASYLNKNNITTNELELWTQSEVTLFNTVLQNTGFTDIKVESKGLFEVEYENNQNTKSDDIFISFFNRELVSADLIKKQQENKADVIHFFSGSNAGTTASVGMIRQIHHSFNLIIQTSTGPAGILAHETGHLLGFHHDWGWENDGIKERLKYNGHKLSQNLGTIMSYADNRVSYYSNLNHKYPDTDVFMGSETQNICEFSKKRYLDSLTVMEKCSLAFERKDYPSIKLDTDKFDVENPDSPIFERMETTSPFPEEYDLLSGMEFYSPVGESVTVINVGDEVDITTSGFYNPVLKLEDDSQRVNYISLYVLVEDSGVSGVIIPSHDSEEIYNVQNDPDAIPQFSQLGIVNTGPAKLVRAYFQSASLTGEFETVVEQDLVINSEQYMHIPQTPVARWRILIKNDTDVDAKVIYVTTDGAEKMSRSGFFSG